MSLSFPTSRHLYIFFPLLRKPLPVFLFKQIYLHFMIQLKTLANKVLPFSMIIVVASISEHT